MFIFSNNLLSDCLCMDSLTYVLSFFNVSISILSIYLHRSCISRNSILLTPFVLTLYFFLSFKNKNLVVSPLSIYQILSLTANGARGNTLHEMVKALSGNSITELNRINSEILKTIKNKQTK